MASYDSSRDNPVPHTVTECQSILFAAAVFIACTLADAQTGPIPFLHDKVAPVLAQLDTMIAGDEHAQDQRRFADALRLYRQGRWSAAYGRFVVLADHGDPRAAHIALAMHRDGPAVYGAQWDATSEQLREWQLASHRAPEALVVLNIRPVAAAN